MYAQVQLLRSAEVVDLYLGFEIRTYGHDGYFAVSRDWSSAIRIVGRDLPATRKQIWMWWFRV